MPASATYLGSDTVTKGDWNGVYGADGYCIADSLSFPPGSIASTPAYLTWGSTTNGNTYDYGSTTYGPKLPPGYTTRSSSIWYGYAAPGMDFELTIAGTKTVRIYLLDNDANGRDSAITILEAGTLTVLDSSVASTGSYVTGNWYSYEISGHVILRLSQAGGNTTVFMFAFDPAGGGGGGFVPAPYFQRLLAGAGSM